MFPRPTRLGIPDWISIGSADFAGYAAECPYILRRALKHDKNESFYSPSNSLSVASQKITTVNHWIDCQTVCQFKARFGSFWMHRDVKNDFTADLTGIGDKLYTK